MKQITIYTDGSYVNQYGLGGYACLLVFNGMSRLVFSGGIPQTSNNRMELQAVITALQLLLEPCNITIYSDSQYVVNGINQWVSSWVRNGWKTAAHRPVENQDLWEEFLAVSRSHHVRAQWVRGHNGHPANELMDHFANRLVRPGSQVLQPLFPVY